MALTPQPLRPRLGASQLDPIGANEPIGTAPPNSAEEVEPAVEWAVHRFRSDRGLSCFEAQARAVELVGGFKWSSQHLDGGGCDEGWETALGSGATSRVAG